MQQNQLEITARDLAREYGTCWGVERMRYDPSSTVLVARVSAVPGEVFRACTGVCSRPDRGLHRGSKQKPIF